MCLRCGRNSHTKFYYKDHKVSCTLARARSMPPIAVHSSQEPHQPQMVRSPTLLALTDEASEHTHQIHFCRQKKKKKSRNQERQKREHAQQPLPQQNDTGRSHSTTPGGQKIHSHPHKGNNSISTHHPHHLHNKYLSMVRLWCSNYPSTAAALRQMAQLHQQHFETSQTQMKALKNITSASSFTSTVDCIPIYDGKDKDACTEWLQRCKEASYYMGHNFRSALLQRSSQDVAKVIRSLDKELHMTNLLKKSCVHSLVSPALQQPLMNCPIYARNLAKTSSSTSTNTETSTGGAPRSCHMKKHTSSHSVSFVLHCRTQ